MDINWLLDPSDLGPEWYQRFRSRKIGRWATWGGVLDFVVYIAMTFAIICGVLLLGELMFWYAGLQASDIFVIFYVLGMTAYFGALLGRLTENRSEALTYWAMTDIGG